MITQVYALNQVQRHVPGPLTAVRRLSGGHQWNGQFNFTARSGRLLLRVAAENQLVVLTWFNFHNNILTNTAMTFTRGHLPKNLPTI